MKLSTYLYTLLFLTYSCYPGNKPSDNSTYEVDTNTDIISEIYQQVPGNILTSKDLEGKEFQADLNDMKIDFDKTKYLSGNWTVISGALSFLNTNLKPNDKVVFIDTISKTATAWEF